MIFVLYLWNFDILTSFYPFYPFCLSERASIDSFATFEPWTSPEFLWMFLSMLPSSMSTWLTWTGGYLKLLLTVYTVFIDDWRETCLSIFLTTRSTSKPSSFSFSEPSLLSYTGFASPDDSDSWSIYGSTNLDSELSTWLLLNGSSSSCWIRL